MNAARTLCLNMIVKNEMANLERCLGAVAPYIACWVIGDTGSTDGTQEFIRSFLAERNIPGELHSFPFENFAQARNEALDRARASQLSFDYLLLTDADMELTVQNPAFSQDLTAAAYKVLQRSSVTYWNNRLLRRDVPASYKGVTHEYLDVRAGETWNLEGIIFIDHGTGSNRVDKYERDARLLTNAIETERDQGMIARYTFYLANTLRDSGQREAALETYLKRARLGHWQQEVFMSLLNVARLKEGLGSPNEEVLTGYLEATAACPTRAEALHGAARFCRDKGIYEQGYEAAAKGLTIAYPDNGLFVQDWIYEYGLLDEFAINAYWTGRYTECVKACDRLLSEGKLPTDKHDRVLKNKEFALAKISEAAALSSSEADPFGELLHAARQKEKLRHPDDEIILAYTEATAACPTRAEALHGAARFCRNKGLYEQGYDFAAKGLAIAYPTGAPSVEEWIYQYGLLDEFSVNAYWTARYDECIDACDRLLNEGKLPAEKRDRVLKNKDFAVGKLREAASLATLGAETPSDALHPPRQKENLGGLESSAVPLEMTAGDSTVHEFGGGSKEFTSAGANADRFDHPAEYSGGVKEATVEVKFLSLAPFLHAADRPKERRDQSRAFDARIMPFLTDSHTVALPQIHCFYEVMSETAQHPSLIAATQSMRAMGHPVRVWSYTPTKLDFLVPYGVELCDAADVVPKNLFERIVAGSEIRYFSDIFRYAALYEHGGLWMDTDVVMVRPFPFHGDHFFNLQWHHVGKGHFICGNVIYAEPYSRHMRNLYERALERFSGTQGAVFGDIGPKLLSDYIASDYGAALREWLFSPMFFNAIDWTEVDKFNQPVADLADYLHDERVTGIHLWNARTHSATRGDDRSLIAMLSNPRERMLTFTSLADHFNTDKNRHTGNRHCYARIYDRLLGTQRFAMRWLMEIGLCRGLAEGNQSETPSVSLWQSHFPFCHVVGVDLTDFSRLNNERFTSFVCDQSKREELRTVAAQLEPRSFDVIIDDGSHASADEQLTLVEFWSLLAEGGWYFIEDLDWQPPGEDRAKIALTKTLLREIQEHGAARSTDPFGVGGLVSQFAEILFFDSHYELTRAQLMGGLVAIRKGGGL